MNPHLTSSAREPVAHGDNAPSCEDCHDRERGWGGVGVKVLGAVRRLPAPHFVRWSVAVSTIALLAMFAVSPVGASPSPVAPPAHRAIFGVMRWT